MALTTSRSNSSPSPTYTSSRTPNDISRCTRTPGFPDQAILPVGNGPPCIAGTLTQPRVGWGTEPVTEQGLSSAYLGPEKGRWTPRAWSDVVEAAAGGLLDESHWLDLKQELPAGKRTHNTELGQDLAPL